MIDFHIFLVRNHFKKPVVDGATGVPSPFSLVNFITTETLTTETQKDDGFNREIGPFYGQSIQVSELFQFTQMTITKLSQL